MHKIEVNRRHSLRDKSTFFLGRVLGIARLAGERAKHIITFVASIGAFAGVLCLTQFGLAKAGGQTLARFTYDSAHRLTAVAYDEPAALCYQYDASGNRTNQIVVGQPNRQADHNGDGMPDLWELIYFGTLEVDPLADPDHDGLNNLAESLAWTDPFTPQSSLRITSATMDWTGFTLRWNAQSNLTYRVWWTVNLNSWSLTNSITTTAGIFADNNAPASQCFYRLSIEP